MFQYTDYTQLYPSVSCDTGNSLERLAPCLVEIGMWGIRASWLMLNTDKTEVMCKISLTDMRAHERAQCASLICNNLY